MTLPDDLAPAWQDVLERWEDPRAHKRFITLCASTRRLEVAGGMYRTVREQFPERAPQAAQHIERVLALALESLNEVRTPPPTRRGRSYYVGLGLGAGLAFYALWALLRLS